MILTICSIGTVTFDADTDTDTDDDDDDGIVYLEQPSASSFVLLFICATKKDMEDGGSRYGYTTIPLRSPC